LGEHSPVGAGLAREEALEAAKSFAGKPGSYKVLRDPPNLRSPPQARQTPEALTLAPPIIR